MSKNYVYRVGGGCALCMTCIYQCPVGAIKMIEDVSARIDENACIGCGSCFDSCQPGAIIRIEKEV